MKYAIVVLLAVIAGSAHAGKSLNQQYPGPWHHKVNLSILRALSAHHAHDCGDVAYKPNPAYSGEYLVYCSMDDGVWHAYIVWADINKVMGPYPADPHVKPPKPAISPSAAR